MDGTSLFLGFAVGFVVGWAIRRLIARNHTDEILGFLQTLPDAPEVAHVAGFLHMIPNGRRLKFVRAMATGERLAEFMQDGWAARPPIRDDEKGTDSHAGS